MQLRFTGNVQNLATAVASATTGQLVATVIGQTPNGQTIVNTAFGHLALTMPTGTRVMPGATVAFEILSVSGGTGDQALDSAAAIPAAGPRPVPTLAREWPSLKAALTALAEADVPLAHQVSEVSIARLGSPHFLRQVLAFIAAPANDVGALLGHAAVTALQQTGHGEAAMRLDGDLREMARLNAAPSDWRAVFVPIFEANEPKQLRIFTRRRKADRGKGREGSGRFVVEIEFQDLGPLQLDGLVQKPRIDVILRSHEALPQEMRRGIVEVFENTCAAAGLAGQLVFQATAVFPVAPLDEMTRSSGGGLSV